MRIFIYESAIFSLCLIFLSCEKGHENTRVVSTFTEKTFCSVNNGDSKTNVDIILGAPFSYFTHIKFKNGSSNNYDGLVNIQDFSDVKSYYYVGNYSLPINPKRDYREYKISFDPEWSVINKQTYFTD